MNNDTHIYPLNDLQEHVAEGVECPCIPTVEVIGANLLIIHNAFDNREIIEESVAVMNGDNIANEILKKINYTHLQVYKPDGVFIATEDDGSQWVMLEDFITAQQSVQRNAYGTGWLVQISNFIIKLGWFIAGISNKKHHE